MLEKGQTRNQDENEIAPRNGVITFPEAEKNGKASLSTRAEPRGVDHQVQLRGERMNILHARQTQSPTPSPSVVYKTVVHVVYANGSTIGKFTVSTLPATVSNTELGVVTIPEETDSQIIVSPSTRASSEPLTLSGTISTSWFASYSTDLSLSASETGAISIESPTVSAPFESLSTVFGSETSLLVSQPPPASSEPLQSATVTPPSGNNLIPALTSAFLADTSSSPYSLDPLQPSNLPVVTSSIPDLLSSTGILSSPLIIASTSSSTSVPFSSIPTSTSKTSIFSTASSLHSSSRTSSATSTISSSSSTSTPTEFIFGGGGGAPTANGLPLPTQHLEGGNGDSDDNLSPPQIIGAIVGSVSGFVLFFLIALFALRARKRKPTQARALPESPMGVGTGDHQMSPRTSVIAASLFAPARAIGRWRKTGQTIRSEEIAPTQRGFEKLGGRKLRPALETGGDGYDDEFVLSEKVFESGSLVKEAGVGVATSSYTHGVDKETGEPSTFSSSPPFDRPLSQKSYGSEKVLFRPSPARAITTASSVSVSSVPASARSGMLSQMPPPPRPPRSPMARAFSNDGIGRSHASMDGSRTSRFTEGLN